MVVASTFTDLRLYRGPRRNETTLRADWVKGLLATRMEGSKAASARSQARPTWAMQMSSVRPLSLLSLMTCLGLQGIDFRVSYPSAGGREGLTYEGGSLGGV